MRDRRHSGTTRSSIRQPGATPRNPMPRVDRPRVAPLPLPAAVPSPVRMIRSRPDPNPLRVIVGVLGVASAAALTTAMLPSIQPADAALDPVAVDVSDPVPEATPQHVTRYVTLKPGQTAPPQSTVVVRPQPTPRVRTKVVTRTRQSGG